MNFLKRVGKEKIILVVCLIALLTQLFQVLSFQRETYLQRYDISYWKDRVEHSRYFMPLSDRGIGDDRFYAYGGYRVVEGEDPTKLVYDKPALGIWIIGVFSYFLQNPAYSGLLFGIGSLLLLYAIVFNLTKSKIVSLISVTFLLFDPLFFSHLSTSLLDLPQLFFLLLNIYGLQFLAKKKLNAFIVVLLSGLSLGLFAQIKIPIVYPLILGIELVWLWKTYGKKLAGVFILGNVAAVAIGYLPYLFQGYSFIEFLKIQKFVFAFYRDSSLPLHMHAIWQYIFTGYFPGVADGIPSKVAEWTLLLPIATVVGIALSIKFLIARKAPFLINLFAIVILCNLILYTFIPSFPRYLILILPFLHFFFVKALFEKRTNEFSLLALIALVMYGLFNTFSYFHQSPSQFLSYFYNNLSNQYFHDIFEEQLTAESKKGFTRDAFHKTNQTVLSQATITSIEVKEEPFQYSMFDTNVSVPVVVTYKTANLGGFSEKKNINVQRENGLWKVVWDSDYLLNAYEADRKIEVERVVGKRGSITSNDGTILAEDKEGYLIAVNPKLFQSEKEQEMLQMFSTLSLVDEPNLQNAYIENPIADAYIPLFTTFTDLTDKQLETLRSYKGVQITPVPARIYTDLPPDLITNTFYEECCTRLYSSSNYHADKEKPGAELQFEKQLSGNDGGYIRIVGNDKKVIRNIIEKEKKDGEDISLPE